jgi:hypothetical protein
MVAPNTDWSSLWRYSIATKAVFVPVLFEFLVEKR